jgi:hypothetical protein
MASKTISIADAMTMVKQFLDNPNDSTLQVAMVDLCRRYPLPTLLLAAGRYDHIVEAIPDHISVRKVSDVIITYDKRELPKLIRELGPEDDDEEDGAENTLDSADEERQVKRRRTPATVGASEDLNSLLDSDE